MKINESYRYGRCKDCGKLYSIKLISTSLSTVWAIKMNAYTFGASMFTLPAFGGNANLKQAQNSE